MVRFGKTTNGHERDYDSVSELSHTDDERSISSNVSKSSAFRSKFLRTGKFGKTKKRGTSTDGSGTASVGSASRASRKSKSAKNGDKASSAGVSTIKESTVKSDARSVGSASRSRRTPSAQTDEKRLVKDAKSRFNIGLVYLKTGDYAKAQDNLEHSLYCHIQLSGHDPKMYTNETLVAIAGVREKLGDCYLANSAIVDKCLALDHYEESKRLLKNFSSEDAPDNVKEMLERVEEQLKSPELSSREVRNRKTSTGATSKYQMKGNDKAKALLGVGAAGGAAAAAAAGHRGTSALGAQSRAQTQQASRPAPAARGKRKSAFDNIDVLGLGIGKGIGKIGHLAQTIGEGIADAFDSSSDEGDGSSRHSALSNEETEGFAMAMSHLKRDNHRTALNYLTSLQEDSSMKSPDFRVEMAMSMLKVADSAMEGQKISVATDAYEEAYAVLKQEEGAASDNTTAAMRGCIKGHKLLAMETEKIRDYGSAIQHRMRVSQLLDENKKCIPACNQLLKVAYLYGEKDDYPKSAVALSDAIRKLWSGIKSIDYMPADRVGVLIQCYHMRAICYSKSKKWSEALDQYDELLPLIAKTEGQGSKAYNSSLIHKSALLVTIGNHRLAQTTVDTYFQLAELSDPDLIVDPLDHVLALDTWAATHLKLGNVDKAAAIFEKKLAFVKTLPNNQEMKSDTMHKLGCLMAYRKQHNKALPMLNEALNDRKVLFDGKHRSVFETTWAVAATNDTLGNTDKALKEYIVLLEKMNKVQDMPVDAVLIHSSVGKLFFENGNVDKAVHAFRQALQGMQTSHNPQLKAQITLSLANALSAKGDADDSMELYDTLLATKSLKKSKLIFLTRYNKSLLFIKMGRVDEAKQILNKISENRQVPDDVKGKILLTLGNLAVVDGNAKMGLDYFEQALEVAEADGDVNAVAQAKKSIGMALAESGHPDKAIDTFEDVLEDLSGAEGKSVNLLKAEVWNCMARVYKHKGDLSQAKNYAKLALQAYKTELGDTNPITLRNKSNLQLLLLEEAEDLEKSEAKPIIDTAKYEMEATLDAFESLNDTWTYRLDVASLKTNLGFVAVWQGKPKKARKLVRQIQEIELPPECSLLLRVTILEERVQDLEKKKGE